jgi:hypothetical protein
MFWAAVRPTLLLVLAVGGCASTPAGEGGAGAAARSLVPTDFSLDVIVRPGPAPADPADDTGRGRSLRPAHYVLFCDGSLHWEGDTVAPHRKLPPLTRVLDRREMAGVWSMLERLGYADPAAGEEPVNAALVEVPPGETYVQSVITGNGDRWARADRRETGSEPDATTVELIEHLAGLAWASAWIDPADEEPLRNEYGPDPYARYRQP